MKNNRIVKIIIQFALVIILLELILRVIFYQQVGRNTLAIIETGKNIKRKFAAPPEFDRMYHDFLLARPDSSKEVNEAIVKEGLASNHFEYAPWAEYKTRDFHGRYFNTEGWIRTTSPAQSHESNTAVFKTIYFFGGSTMYGLNVTDRETVASAFVNEYNTLFPNGRPIKVVNYGISAYHSYNELMLMSHLVYSGQRPDITISLDGMNDFLMPSAVLNKIPYYYYRLSMASKDKLSLKELEHINDSTNRLFEIPPGLNKKEMPGIISDIYLSNISHAQHLADANHIKAYFFVQPTPFYNYPNKFHDPICDKSDNWLVREGYGLLEKKITSMTHVYFLGNMLSEEKGYPFIDRFHYSPKMSIKIAKEIAIVVGKQLNEENPSK